MIYTVTFNPSLDYIVSVDDFKLGLTNRTSSELMLPGGKGINVSIVLKNLGIQSTALGFMAGFTGKEIARRLEEEGVASDFIQIEEGISRINLKLKSIDGTEINGSGPKIPKEKVEELMIAETGEVYSSPAPKGTLVNGVGAGDSMVAGFMTGWMEKQDYEHAFRMGVATGSASAFSEYLATRPEVEEVYKQLV